MKQFFSLVGVLFRARYKFRLPSKTKPAYSQGEQKKDYTWLIMLLLGVAFIPIIFSLVMGVAEVAPIFQKEGALTELMLFIYVITMLVIIIMGVVNMLSYVYFNRDSEFLAGLPIKSWKIFLAKLFLVYITELALAAAALIPLNFTIGIVTGQGPVFYLGTLLSVLLVPALPMLLASIIAVPLMFLVSFFRNKGALTSIVILLLVSGILVVYYYFYFNFMIGSGADGLDDAFIGMIAGIKSWEIVFYPLTALIRFCLLESVFGLSPAVSALVNLAIVIGCFALMAFVSGFIANFVYHKSVISQSLGGGDKGKGKAEAFKSGSIRAALIKKEWRAMIRESAFAFQCVFGMVVGPVLTAFLASMPKMVDFSALQATEEMAPFMDKIISQAPALLLIFMCIFLCAGTNVAACSAISREGKNFYITKIMPVPYKAQIQAKLYLSLCISLAGCLISTVLGGTLMKLPFWQFFVILGFLGIYSYAFSCFAVKFDMAKPRLNWSTPNEAVKNSRSSTVPVLLNLAVGFALILLMAVFISFDAVLAMWIVMFAAVAGVAWLFHFRLFKNLDASYEAIEF